MTLSLFLPEKFTTKFCPRILAVCGISLDPISRRWWGRPCRLASKWQSQSTEC